MIQEMDLKNLRSRRDALSELQDLLQKGLCGLMDGCGLARGGPALTKRMVRYAHFRGIVQGGPVFRE